MTERAGTATINRTAPRGGSWCPVEGDETGELLYRTFPDEAEARGRLAEASRAILSRCAEPGGPVRGDAGLTIGYVQSGKTLSFTTVAALARDNGYSMVVLIGGTSKYLLEQTEGRLAKDLAIGEKRTWLHIRGPRQGIKPAQRAADVRTMQAALDKWQDDDFDQSACPTVIVTVMKHAGNLSKLADMIAELRPPPAPALIIDDEADQASLDANAASDTQTNPTKTYAAISRLRQAMATNGVSHTFLQYTATPQANLLIEISDALSPSFVQVLEPGGAYVGGKELFIEKAAAHVRSVPAAEMEDALEAQEGPPESLRAALASFLVGIGADHHSGFAGSPRSNRSMLIHPSRLTGDHSRLREWIDRMKADWSELLQEEAASTAPEEREFLLAFLRKAHRDLSTTDPGLPSFDELIRPMRVALKDTQVLELNRGAPPVPWSRHFSFILIGGQAIERGFTVEGLTTTHLARSLGQRLADSIQQRARFFGYKRGYLGRIRIWTDDDTRSAFREYAEHEEALREQLKPVAEEGRPLRDWRRQFLLSPSLRPTRRSVLTQAVKQRRLSDDWLMLDRPAILGSDLDDNRSLLNRVQSSVMLDEDTGHEARTAEQRHLVSTGLPIAQLLEVLADIRVADADQRDMLYGAMLQLDEFVGQPGRSARIYLMGKGRLRERKIEAGKVAQLHQGRNPRTGTPVYPGDREIMIRDEPSLQIHVLRTKDGRLKDVPAFALWMPVRYAGQGTAVQSSA
ncbi:Z1 domain-containing protein [Pseudoroseicyclus tamaricis]|uniref:Putative endonuclease Z1 domain-containing protein n=1 Tax=Pseudoroseicyclus tamaricis TaxID=2705421 RepID=A0A6B2K2R1_9RHOB|nr:Z1 domain-containing protein [Pseudoroseicyclus tamaricis]NDV02894.1 hypothetical protein [Pseudoroseicyclus tamaricis]